MFIMLASSDITIYKYISEMDEYFRRKLLFPSMHISNFDILLLSSANQTALKIRPKLWLFADGKLIWRHD